MRWSLVLFCLATHAGCGLLDRQEQPQIVELSTDQDDYPSVGRGSKVQITLFTDDADNDELDYLWTDLKKEEGGQFEASKQDSLRGLFQDSVTVVWIAPVATGVYTLKVEVDDGKSGTITEGMVEIHVTQGAPVADAGMDRTVPYASGLRVTLDGTGSSDPDRDALRYTWTQLDGPGVDFDAENSMPVFRAVAPADFIFELRVRDDIVVAEGAITSEPDTVTVRVDDRLGFDF
ncbi:MAG: hypothetical protein OXR72_19250 [Gemmatimonadota bacterium]|nr:hypothetical protein [Gemmatimonadota bacterium]